MTELSDYIPTCVVERDSDGKHCPGEGKHKIGMDEQTRRDILLCDQCYETYKNSGLKRGEGKSKQWKASG